MIKAVIFDMNGVIIDDEYIHEVIFGESLKPFGIAITKEDYLECCAGRTDREGYEAVGRKFDQDLPVDELISAKARLYLKQFPRHKKAYPGVIELIQDLAVKYKLALVSSASRSEIDLITSEFGVDSLFEFTISAQDVKVGKPDPEPYQKAIGRLELQPDECAVVEDSRNGIKSAKGAGCYCIAVTNTHRKSELVEADVVVEKYSDIPALLQRVIS